MCLAARHWDFEFSPRKRRKRALRDTERVYEISLCTIRPQIVHNTLGAFISGVAPQTPCRRHLLKNQKYYGILAVILPKSSSAHAWHSATPGRNLHRSETETRLVSMGPPDHKRTRSPLACFPAPIMHLCSSACHQGFLFICSTEHDTQHSDKNLSIIPWN